MAARVEAIEGAEPCLLGEGAFWHEESGYLWWVDIRGSELFRYHAETGHLQAWSAPEWITRVIPNGPPGQLVGTLASRFCRIDTNGERLKLETLVSLEEKELRFNDGAIDPDGTYWAGTMPLGEDRPTGRWMCIGPGNKATYLETPGFTVTNGPAFDAAHQFVYLTDSAAGRIYRANLEPEAGLQFLQTWRSFEPQEGYPDGMVIGPDGLLWVAFWDGGCLRALDSEGNVRRTVELPVIRPTSISFRSRDTLYVTSASYGLDQDGTQGLTLQVQLDG